jgi:hypothetical protein
MVGSRVPLRDAVRGGFYPSVAVGTPVGHLGYPAPPRTDPSVRY